MRNKPIINKVPKIDLSELEPYCANDMKLLKQMTYKYLKRQNEDVCQEDLDDFFSLANYVLFLAYLSYDPNDSRGASFETYFRFILQNRIKTEIRDRHRFTREQRLYAVSTEKNIYSDDEDDAHTILDLIADNNNYEYNVIEKINREKLHENINKTDLDELTKNMMHLKMEGYKNKEIGQILNIRAYDCYCFFKYRAKDIISSKGTISKYSMKEV